MTTIQNILQTLDQFAPTELAESWDNVGLLCGGDGPVTRALIALDITGAVAREACEKGAQLVVSHHPVIFKSIAALRSDTPLWKLSSGGVSAICMHTNLDICEGGVNDTLARQIGLCNTQILLETGRRPYKKITVFVPKDYEKAIRVAMAQAGAGKLGAYDSCSFSAKGTGHFRPLADANPFIGTPGQLETVEEVRIEAICRAGDLSGVISAMLAAHPYEVPAYDVFTDEALWEPYGLGKVGELTAPFSAAEFAALVRKKLGSPIVGVYGCEKPVRRIALCSGAGDEDVLQAALKVGADLLLTGELKHSLILEAVDHGLTVVTAGHFATENVICPVLLNMLAEKFPEVSFEIAQSNTDPALI